MSRKILIVDDDTATLKFVAANLEANNYEPLKARDGKEALKIIEKEFPALLILDVMMPEVDGFEVCRRLREWSQVPIIMLSAKCDEEDKVKCLDMGADDYLCKPFGLDELLSRIRAVLRRSDMFIPAKTPPPAFTSGNLDINFVERRVKTDSCEIPLTVTEFALLQELALNSPKVLTYQLLLQRVWGPEYGDERGYLYVFMRRLRKKLERDPQNPSHILSVRDVGYRLE
jgi:two-component system, OmpR family, KDP operon response regulator KdpE